MESFAPLRQRMVQEQLIARGISDQRVIKAFLTVPREAFVPGHLAEAAYDDGPLPIGSGQTISQPYMVASMTELLHLAGKEKVLEVGTGSGYQAAILAELCQKVYTIERVAPLMESAKAKLDSLGYRNIEFVIGDGTLGYQKAAPFDGIIVTAACPIIPQPLIDQLAEGGRLVLPIGERFMQTLTLVEKKKGEIKIASLFGCVFVPLIGQYGWPD